MSTKEEEVLIDLLRQVKEVLDEHSIEFWLECGTLLGAIRDQKFLPWEHDIDLGSWHGKVPKNVRVSVAKALRKRGYKVWIAENHINIKEGANFWADINFYLLDKDKAIKPTLNPKNFLGKFLSVLLPRLWAPCHPRGGIYKLESPLKRFIVNILTNISRRMPIFIRKPLAQALSKVYKKVGSKDVSWVVPFRYFSNLLTIKFYDMEFRVPTETESYLSYRYGDDWQIPKRDWVTVKEDGAIVRFLK